MKTKKQAIAWAKSKKGKGIDYDGFFGWQCADLTVAYMMYITEDEMRMWGNAIDAPKNSFGSYAKVIKNTPSFEPQAGDIVVWTTGNFNQYGHIAIVLDGNPDGNLMTLTVIEQNWLGGGASFTEKATIRKHNYNGITHFIRPNFAKSKTTKAKETVKNVVSKVTPSKQKHILLVAGHGNSDPGAVAQGTNERDFIRKSIVPAVAKNLRDAGHKVSLYGGASMNQNLFVDTAYGQRIGNKKDYGLYWCKSQKYDIIVEFHLDAAGASASGGHVIKNAYAADSIDKALDKMLSNSVGTIRGITTRKDLLNCNVAYDLNLNYRLVELGFITSKKDMDYIKKNLNSFNKGLAEAINGGTVGTTTVKPAAKAKQTKWSWKGKFTPNTTIKVRKSPSTRGVVVDSGSWLYKNDWVEFNQIIKANGYWWIRFKYAQPGSSKNYFYCAVCKITDKKEKIKNEKYWGSIKWK